MRAKTRAIIQLFYKIAISAHKITQKLAAFEIISTQAKKEN